MNHLFALLISTLLTINVAAQNWVEVNLDTNTNLVFYPTDLEFIDSNTVLLGGYDQYEWGGGVLHGNQGFYISQNQGQTWDTLLRFKTFPFSGENTKLEQYDNALLLIHGRSTRHNNNQNPPVANGYEISVYDRNFQKTRTLFDELSIGHYLKDVIFIDGDKALLTKTSEQFGGFYFDYPQLLDLNTLQLDSIPLPVYIEYINDIHFVDSLRGYMACGSQYQEQSGYILTTANGGIDWTVLTDNSSSAYHCIEFFDKNRGIATSGQGLIYFSENGGFDWQLATGFPARFKATDVCTAGDNTAYMIGFYEFYYNARVKSYTQVYKSQNDGKNWCLVYEDTTNNNKTERKISFTDENTGVATIRPNIAIYTKNGFGQSCVTGIEEYTSLNPISIFPNPSSGTFSVLLPGHVQMEHLSIFDLAGKEVFTTQPTDNTISISGLPNGVYLVKVMDSNTQMYVQRMVIAH